MRNICCPEKKDSYIVLEKEKEDIKTNNKHNEKIVLFKSDIFFFK